jgi:hypothetical protein
MVIELAKKLVAREEFLALKDDAARVERLYALLYQRLPEPDEVELGINFLNDMPVPAVMMASSEPTGQNQQRPKARPNQNRTANRKAATKAPLTAWQEYAQALLQANEFIFVQ